MFWLGSFYFFFEYFLAGFVLKISERCKEIMLVGENIVKIL